MSLLSSIIRPKAQEASPGWYRTLYEVNSLDQTVRTVSSLPFAYETRFFYDRNGQLERVERDLRDENGAAILGGVEVKVFAYDEASNLVSEWVGGSDLAPHLMTRHVYNAAGGRVRKILPKGNEVWFGFDERLLQTSVTRAA